MPDERRIPVRPDVGSSYDDRANVVGAQGQQPFRPGIDKDHWRETKESFEAAYQVLDLAESFGVSKETDGLTLVLKPGVGSGRNGPIKLSVNTPINMNPSSLNFVEFNPSTGQIEVNQVGWGTGRVPLWKIATDIGAITAQEDNRIACSRVGVPISQQAFSDFDENPGQTGGLVWGYNAGYVRNDNRIYYLNAGQIALAPSATNYIELLPNGTMVANQNAFTQRRIPIRRVNTSATSIIGSEDKRAVFAFTFPDDPEYPIADYVQRGIIEIATLAECIAAVDEERAVPPKGLSDIYGKLADHETRITDLENGGGTGGANFTIVPQASSLALSATGSVNTVIDIVRLGGFANAVVLTVPSLPANTVVTFTPNNTTGNTTTMTVTTTGASSSTGAIGITATSSTLSRYATVGYTISNASNYSISSVSSINLPRSTSLVVAVPISRVNGHVASVGFSATGMPSGLTVTYSPVNTTTNTVNATFSANSAVPLGVYTININATDGTLPRTTPIDVVLQAASDFDLTLTSTAFSLQSSNQTPVAYANISRTGGFTSAITMTAINLPAGVTAVFQTNPVPGSSTPFFLNANSSVVSGSYNFTIRGTAGATPRDVSCTLTLTAAPSFTIAMSNSALTTIQGVGTSNTVLITRTGGHTAQVSLTTSGVPANVSPSFSPNPAVSSSSTLNLAPNTNAALATNTITVTATDGSITQSATFSLTVNAAPDFSLAASAANAPQSGSGTSTVSLARFGGLTTQVNLALENVPANVGHTITPSGLVGAGLTAAVTFSPGATAIPGNYAPVLRGIAGALQRTTPIALTITSAAQQQGFTIEVTHAAGSSSVYADEGDFVGARNLGVSAGREARTYMFGAGFRETSGNLTIPESELYEETLKWMLKIIPVGGFSGPYTLSVSHNLLPTQNYIPPTTITGVGNIEYPFSPPRPFYEELVSPALASLYANQKRPDLAWKLIDVTFSTDMPNNTSTQPGNSGWGGPSVIYDTNHRGQLAWGTTTVVVSAIVGGQPMVRTKTFPVTLMSREYPTISTDIVENFSVPSDTQLNDRIGFSPENISARVGHNFSARGIAVGLGSAGRSFSLPIDHFPVGNRPKRGTISSLMRGVDIISGNPVGATLSYGFTGLSSTPGDPYWPYPNTGDTLWTTSPAIQVAVAGTVAAVIVGQTIEWQIEPLSVTLNHYRPPSGFSSPVVGRGRKINVNSVNRHGPTPVPQRISAGQSGVVLRMVDWFECDAEYHATAQRDSGIVYGVPLAVRVGFTEFDATNTTPYSPGVTGVISYNSTTGYALRYGYLSIRANGAWPQPGITILYPDANNAYPGYTGAALSLSTIPDVVGDVQYRLLLASNNATDDNTILPHLGRLSLNIASSVPPGTYSLPITYQLREVDDGQENTLTNPATIRQTRTSVLKLTVLP
jgi:hypothetical protein